MSRAAKVTLAVTSALTVAVVISVHYAQQAEQEVNDRFPEFDWESNIANARWLRRCMPAFYETSNNSD